MTPFEIQSLANQQRILEALWNLQQAVARIAVKDGAFESTEEYQRLRDELPQPVNVVWTRYGAGNNEGTRDPELGGSTTTGESGEGEIRRLVSDLECPRLIKGRR